MNIFELINRFWVQGEENSFSPTEAGLYFFLLYRANRKKWIMPFSCPSVVIRASLNTSRQNFEKARMSLQERGLIKFIAGKNKKEFPQYSLFDTSNLSPTELPAQMPTELPAQLPPNNINIKENIIPTPTDSQVHEKDWLKKEGEWFEEIMCSQCEKEKLSMYYGVTIEEIDRLLKKYKSDIDFTLDKHPNRVAFRHHVKCWLNRHFEINNNKTKNRYDTANRTGSTREERQAECAKRIAELRSMPDTEEQIWQ